MKPSSTRHSPPYSQPFDSSSTNSQAFTYDLPKDEPDSNASLWDPNYSDTTPEGTGGEVKPPTDTNNGSTKALGNQTTYMSICIHFKVQTGNPSFILLSNISPTTSSETFIHEVIAVVLSAATHLSIIFLITSENRLTAYPIT